VQVPYTGKERLYDLSSDPGERDDLLRQGGAEIEATAAALRQRLEAWAASAAPLESHFEPSQRLETIERLRALGYLGEEN